MWCYGSVLFVRWGNLWAMDLADISTTMDLFRYAAQTPMGSAELARFPELASPMDKSLGVRYLYAGADKVEAEVAVTEALVQPWGKAHGGLYATLAESVGSLLGVLVAGGDLPVVGVNNSTNFIRATGSGSTIHAVGTVVTAGKTTQLLRVTMTSDHQLVAETSLRTIVLRSVPGGR